MKEFYKTYGKSFSDIFLTGGEYVNLTGEEVSKLKMTDKIDILTKITNAEKKEQKAGSSGIGGSISTNNSIRKQIFTDLKYITKYLKYKTKYIVFKSKH